MGKEHINPGSSKAIRLFRLGTSPDLQRTRGTAGATVGENEEIRARTLTHSDVDDLCLGATLLGTGGGGDPYVAKLVVKQAIETFGPVDVVDVSELPPDGLVLTTAIIGAPTVILEKIPAGTEFIGAVRALSAYLGKEPVAIMPIEVGGLNTLLPIATAAEMGLPVVDADSMRRAFPQIEMTVFTLAGLKATPLAIADEKGNMCVIEAVTNLTAERLARAAVIQLGLANGISAYPLTVQQVADHAIHGSITYCTELGRQLGAVQRGADGAWDDFLANFEAVESVRRQGRRHRSAHHRGLRARHRRARTPSRARPRHAHRDPEREPDRVRGRRRRRHACPT